MKESPPVLAPTAPDYGTPVNLEQARAVLARAEEEARKRGVAMSFAVVEPSGRLVAFAKMDGANYSSIDSAIKKATAAAVWRQSTSFFGNLLKENMLVVLSLPEAYGSLGGETILVGGKVAGGVGISGHPCEGEVGRLAAAALS